jgi:hypothetical protein
VARKRAVVARPSRIGAIARTVTVPPVLRSTELIVADERRVLMIEARRPAATIELGQERAQRMAAVLERQQQRAVGGHPSQQPERELEQAILRRGADRRRRIGGVRQIGQQPGELHPAGRQQPFASRAVEPAGVVAQRLDERRGHVRRDPRWSAAASTSRRADCRSQFVLAADEARGRRQRDHGREQHYSEPLHRRSRLSWDRPSSAAAARVRASWSTA